MVKNNQLLVRIDERLKNTQEDIKDIKENQKEVFGALKDHSGRIKVIESEHKKPMHSGIGGWIFKIFFGR